MVTAQHCVIIVKTRFFSLRVLLKIYYELVMSPMSSSNFVLGNSWATCFDFRVKRPKIFLFAKISDSIWNFVARLNLMVLIINNYHYYCTYVG